MKFNTRDKYAAFLDGNNGYSVIEGDGEGSILVVKDSYANSFNPLPDRQLWQDRRGGFPQL